MTQEGETIEPRCSGERCADKTGRDRSTNTVFSCSAPTQKKTQAAGDFQVPIVLQPTIKRMAPETVSRQ